MVTEQEQLGGKKFRARAAPPPSRPPPASKTNARPSSYRELIKLASSASPPTINDIQNENKRYAFRSRKSNKETKDGEELKSKQKKIRDVETLYEEEYVTIKVKSFSSQEETRDAQELKSKEKKVGDVGFVDEDQNGKENTKSCSSQEETRDGKELNPEWKIGDVETVEEDQNEKEKAKGTKDGKALKSKGKKIRDVDYDNEDQIDKEKARRRKREQIKDHGLDATLDLASGGSKKRGRGRPKKMSSQGGSRIQVEEKTQLVRKPYPHLAITHPTSHKGESADSPGSPSAVPSTSAGPSTFSASDALPVVGLSRGHYSSQEETKDAQELKSEEKKIEDVGIVNEDQNEEENTKIYSSQKDGKALESKQKIGDVENVNEDQNEKEKAKGTKDGKALKSKGKKIRDVDYDNEDQIEKEKASKRKREQIKDQLDATLDLASGGSKKRGRGCPKKGTGIRVDGHTQLVHKPYPDLGITHPTTQEGESADSPGSPCAGPSTSAGPSTFSVSDALPVVEGRDSRGRIIISVSEFRQFVGGVPSPSRWFTRLLRKWKWNVCWKQFKNIDDDTKNTWWTEFQNHYTWPGYSDEWARFVFYELMTVRYRDFIHDTKTRYYYEHKQPGYFPDDVWASFVAYWESDEAAAASERAKRNRASVEGSGAKHASGSISIAEHLNRMKREHGPDVDFSDVFASTHITVRDLGQPPQWIDAKAEAIYTQYRTTVEAEVAEGRLDHVGEKLPWCPQIWKEVASQGRKKRGKRVYGFGYHGGEVILPSRSDVFRGFPSTPRSHSTGQSTLDVADLESRVEQAEHTNERILAENERIIAENERIRVENERILAQMRLLMESFQPGFSTCSPPAQD